MTAKPQLVLDLAGVLVSNFSPVVWLKLSEGSEISFQDIRGQFDEIRKDLWTGKIKEEEFWGWMSQRMKKINKEQARELLMQSLEPLPGLNYLAEWSEIADIHILSNHCKEWLEPILERVEPYSRSITISNQVGLSKPDIRIFQHVGKQFESGQTVVYIDDQEKNLNPVIELGWKTLLADKEHKWIEQVEPMLGKSLL
ncbi:HAD-IA family hydrolase [Paenibacillus lautus]|uniref:HAD-IA family hydrolase n=1 Tax=Paenibacillus lautus TaxID=1401 RepID=UPI000FDBEFE3|nr:HAD-IA family hydrolase [Paenibacillus lautus]